MLIYRRSENEGEVIIHEVMLGFSGSSEKTFIKPVEKLTDYLQQWINKLEKGQIFVTGNSSTIGNGVFPDCVFTEYTKIKDPIYGDVETYLKDIAPKMPLCMEAYRKKGDTPADDVNYQKQYPPGDHYVKANQALKANVAYRISGTEEILNIGKINNIQKRRLEAEKTPIEEIGGEAAFVIEDENKYNKLTGERWRHADIYIEHNNIAPTQSIPSIVDTNGSNSSSLQTKRKR